MLSTALRALIVLSIFLSLVGAAPIPGGLQQRSPSLRPEEKGTSLHSWISPLEKRYESFRAKPAPHQKSGKLSYQSIDNPGTRKLWISFWNPGGNWRKRDPEASQPKRWHCMWRRDPSPARANPPGIEIKLNPKYLPLNHRIDTSPEDYKSDYEKVHTVDLWDMGWGRNLKRGLSILQKSRPINQRLDSDPDSYQPDYEVPPLYRDWDMRYGLNEKRKRDLELSRHNPHKHVGTPPYLSHESHYTTNWWGWWGGFGTGWHKRSEVVSNPSTDRDPSETPPNGSGEVSPNFFGFWNWPSMNWKRWEAETWVSIDSVDSQDVSTSMHGFKIIDTLVDGWRRWWNGPEAALEGKGGIEIKDVDCKPDGESTSYPGEDAQREWLGGPSGGEPGPTSMRKDVEILVSSDDSNSRGISSMTNRFAILEEVTQELPTFLNGPGAALEKGKEREGEVLDLIHDGSPLGLSTATTGVFTLFARLCQEWTLFWYRPHDILTKIADRGWTTQSILERSSSRDRYVPTDPPNQRIHPGTQSSFYYWDPFGAGSSLKRRSEDSTLSTRGLLQHDGSASLEKRNSGRSEGHGHDAAQKGPSRTTFDGKPVVSAWDIFGDGRNLRKRARDPVPPPRSGGYDDYRSNWFGFGNPGTNWRKKRSLDTAPTLSERDGDTNREPVPPPKFGGSDPYRSNWFGFGNPGDNDRRKRGLDTAPILSKRDPAPGTDGDGTNVHPAWFTPGNPGDIGSDPGNNGRKKRSLNTAPTLSERDGDKNRVPVPPPRFGGSNSYRSNFFGFGNPGDNGRRKRSLDTAPTLLKRAPAPGTDGDGSNVHPAWFAPGNPGGIGGKPGAGGGPGQNGRKKRSLDTAPRLSKRAPAPGTDGDGHTAFFTPGNPGDIGDNPGNNGRKKRSAPTLSKRDPAPGANGDGHPSWFDPGNPGDIGGKPGAGGGPGQTGRKKRSLDTVPRLSKRDPAPDSSGDGHPSWFDPGNPGDIGGKPGAGGGPGQTGRKKRSLDTAPIMSERNGAAHRGPAHGTEVPKVRLGAYRNPNEYFDFGKIAERDGAADHEPAPAQGMRGGAGDYGTMWFDFGNPGDIGRKKRSLDTTRTLSERDDAAHRDPAPGTKDGLSDWFDYGNPGDNG